MNPFKDDTSIKVMLAEPSSGLIDCIAHDNRIDAYMDYARLESRSKFKFFTGNVGRCGVGYAREMIAGESIKQGMDYVFMVDDDMILPKNCFERVFETMQREKAELAAPLCTQRHYPFTPVIYKHTVTLENGVQHINNEHVEDYEPNSVVTCDGFGFGVALISVPFLKKMQAICPEGMFFSNRFVGEDIWFCMVARQKLDAKIVVDTSIKVGHLCHPKMATEWDYIQAKGLQEKFRPFYDKTAIAPSLVIGTQPRDWYAKNPLNAAAITCTCGIPHPNGTHSNGKVELVGT